MLHWRQWSEPSGDVWHLLGLLVLQEVIWFLGACNSLANPLTVSQAKYTEPTGSEEQVQACGGTDAAYLICVPTAWGSLSTSLTLLLSQKPWQGSSGEMVNPCLAAFCLGSVLQVPASLLDAFGPLLHPSWLLQAGGMGTWQEDLTIIFISCHCKPISFSAL